jgi:hypothetical protein
MVEWLCVGWTGGMSVAFRLYRLEVGSSRVGRRRDRGEWVWFCISSPY